MLFRIRRRIKFCYQRLTRGFDDSELWSLDVTIAEFILPRLRVFRDYHNGYPHELDSNQWDSTIATMVEAFEHVVSDDYYSLENYKEKVEPGLKLFAKYFCNLWD